MGEYADDFLNSLVEDESRFDDIAKNGPRDQDDRDFMEEYSGDDTFEGPLSGFFRWGKLATAEELDDQLRSLELMIENASLRSDLKTSQQAKKPQISQETVQKLKQLKDQIDSILSSQENRDRSYWKTADGKLLLPEEMTTKHLENAVNVMRKRGQENHQIVQDMQAELDTRK